LKKTTSIGKTACNVTSGGTFVCRGDLRKYFTLLFLGGGGGGGGGLREKGRAEICAKIAFCGPLSHACVRALLDVRRKCYG
jgi:hypothetical protein